MSWMYIEISINNHRDIFDSCVGTIYWHSWFIVVGVVVEVIIAIVLSSFLECRYLLPSLLHNNLPSLLNTAIIALHQVISYSDFTPTFGC